MDICAINRLEGREEDADTTYNTVVSNIVVGAKPETLPMSLSLMDCLMDFSSWGCG